MQRPRSQAILLVDGYNIVGAWPDLKRMRDCASLEAARRDLIETLTNYSAFQGFDTQIVFDSQYQDTPGTTEVVTHQVSVQYTDFGQTADTYIEKMCAAFRYDSRKFEQRLIVATSDRAQQLTVVGYGAEWMSAQKLAHEVEAATRRVRKQQRTTSRPASRFLSHSLDPVARQKLGKLRFGHLYSDEI
ncbi:RNA-binding protein [Leptolyngbya sp. 'hensonii']|uniref:NYN domain-containing protein n=1 Tax=Leptolyngbya sp. 'hensonii' TaxID=1922337 RepID=UPI00095024F6|nr:NYN domain-containing protein [Leptolyngbya sp. 'hensonii']OLP18537.1 RNA-binding protein [Leptolyngbya sp. 'hensonii']